MILLLINKLKYWQMSLNYKIASIDTLFKFKLLFQNYILAYWYI